MKRALLLVLLLACALLAIWYYQSPDSTYRNLRDAARAGDAERIDRYVNFDSVRANLRQDVRSFVQSRSDREGVAGQLGLMLGGYLAELGVDAFISPAGIAALTRGREPGSDPEAESRDYSIDRNGLNHFTVRFDPDREGRHINLIFRRDGLRWELTRITLSD